MINPTQAPSCLLVHVCARAHVLDGIVRCIYLSFPRPTCPQIGRFLRLSWRARGVGGGGESIVGIPDSFRRGQESCSPLTFPRGLPKHPAASFWRAQPNRIS